MSFLQRALYGPYPRTVFLIVVGLGTAAISSLLVTLQGWATYQGHDTIPGAVNLSETLFTGFLVTFITGIVLHRHASMGGNCATLDIRTRCPFAGIFALGLGLGILGVGWVFLTHGPGPISYPELLRFKMIQGAATGFCIPFLFHGLKLLKHPKVTP